MIAQTRGSPIDTFGAADLLVRDARGERQRIMQADQTVYLDPRATRPSGPAIEVGGDALPDVVLEVDNTTDVRRGKLALCESWGFPEVWVGRVLRNRLYASGSIALWCSPTTYAACSAENLVGRRHIPQTVTGTPSVDGGRRKIFSSQVRSGARSNTIRWPASAAHRSP